LQTAEVFHLGDEGLDIPVLSVYNDWKVKEARRRRIRSPSDRSVGAGRAGLSFRNTPRGGWLVAIGDPVRNSTE